MAKVEIFKGYWNVKDCVENENAMFIFGDNDVFKGCGGQAIIRNCTNSYGIPTKKYPNYDKNSYYTDKEYTQNKQKILFAIQKILKARDKYEIMYFPKDGFGTGLAKLKEKAPRTFLFLNMCIKKYFGIAYKN